MFLAEYNFWRSTESHDECARHCLDESRIRCKSFSYSASALGCGIYENSREDAPPGVYGLPISQLTEKGISPSWIYYERKTGSYKNLEIKVKNFNSSMSSQNF